MAGVNIFGQLIRMQLENSASDLTPTATGLAYFNTSTGLKWYTGSAWSTAVELSAAQVITNKDIDGGTASNTVRVTLPKSDTVTLDALTRKAGTIVYDTTTGTAKIDNGTSLSSLSTSATASSTAQGLVTTFVPTIVSAIKAVASANYTILDNDGYSTILVTTGASNRTITLPTAADNAGREITVCKVDSGAGFVILDGEGSETIDGSTTKTVYFNNGKMHVVCDGVAWFLTSPIVETGTYTPTLTGSTNIAATTAYTCMYQRVNNLVQVWGSLDADPTAAAFTSTDLTITLPIASDIVNVYDLSGVSVGIDGGQPNQSGRVIGGPGGDNAVLVFLAGSVANQNHRFNFSYIIA
jgi:hypothetical protein